MATKSIPTPALDLAEHMCQDKTFQRALASLVQTYLDHEGTELESDLWDMDKISKEAQAFKNGQIKGTPWREVFGAN